MELVGKILRFKHDQTIWFLHVGRNLGEKPIWRNTYRAADVVTNRRTKRLLEPFCQLARTFPFPFIAQQPKAHLINAMHLLNGQDTFENFLELLELVIETKDLIKIKGDVQV